jgi:hypothetical protein
MRKQIGDPITARTIEKATDRMTEEIKSLLEHLLPEKNLLSLYQEDISFRNVVIVRPFGHAYHGYGRFHLDNDAWKWLAFTAITLKILDNINEAAQRAHEDAQIKAVTAPIGQKIIWSEGGASGSVVATKEGKDAKSGLTCREFQQTITVGGNIENAYGTACLQADGAWKIVQ